MAYTSSVLIAHSRGASLGSPEPPVSHLRTDARPGGGFAAIPLAGMTVLGW